MAGAADLAGLTGAAGFTAPLAYSPWWTVLAVLAVVVVVGWYAALARRTWRLRRPAVDSSPTVPTRSLEDLRALTLSRIDALIAEADADRIGARAAYEALSREVRTFVGAATDRPLRAMTLADVRASGVPRVPDLIEVLYPGQFGTTDPGSPSPVLRAGREVVATWT